MNSIWNKNIQLFKERFPSLADFYHNIIEGISKNGATGEVFSFWKVSTAKNGNVTAQIDNMLLHSSYNPEREGQTAAKELASKNKETIIFMGAGLGWQICSLAKMIVEEPDTCPVKKLVLVEPDPYHLFAALFYLDWSDVFKVGPLVIALGCPADSLMGLLEGNDIHTGNSGVNAAYVYAIPSFILHARAYYDSVIALIERNRSKNNINAATYKKFEKLWIRNSVKNIQQIENCRTINDFIKNLHSETENFVVVAAGPSLETVLPKMAEIKKHAVIVCVETALHAMLRTGVEPDFIVLTDPQYYAYKHIASLASPSSVLVCPLSVYPAAFRFKCCEILLCSEMFPVSTFFEQQLGQFGYLGAGGSVASSAWNLCRMLGAKNIYFAGLDLSYTAKQTHIRGSSAEQSFHINEDRIKGLQKYSAGAMFDANPEYATAYNGKKVLTDTRMKMFAWWFESNIASTTETKTYTLCDQSMKIPGVEVAQIDEVLKGQRIFAPSPDTITGKTDISSAKQLFTQELKKLTSTINLAVEKCIINGPNIQSELSQIEQQIADSPLVQIIALARPSSDDRLEVYKSLQKTMNIYNNSMQL